MESTPRHPARWILALLVVFLVVYAGALQVARGRTTSVWDELGIAWGGWLHESPNRLRGVRDVLPTSAGRLWRGLEGTISWPGHRVKEQGTLLHVHREVSWTQRNRGFSVFVRQERHWLAIRTHVRLSGRETPPKKLLGALREVLGEDGVQVVVEP